MNFSSYQKNIFNWINGNTNGMVIAVAGSGKTTTGVETIKRIMLGKVWCCTFTKAIAEEMKIKLKSYTNVDVSNYNSFGWRLCYKLNRNVQFNENKTKDILTNKIHDDKKLFRLLNPIQKLVSLFKARCCFGQREASLIYNELVDYYDIDIPDIKNFTGVGFVYHYVKE